MRIAEEGCVIRVGEIHARANTCTWADAHEYTRVERSARC